MSLNPPPPRKRNAEATRAELLETASRIFADRGFDGARVDEIAQRAGVNKRMIYVYFGSKDELYREVLGRHFEQVIALSRSALSSETDPRAQAATILRRYLHFLAEHPDLVRLLAWENLANSRRAGDVLVDMASTGLKALHGVVEAGIAQGVFRRDLEPRKLVMSLSALCLGYFSQRMLVETVWAENLVKPEVLEDVLEHFLKLVFEGFCVPRDGPGTA